MEQLLDRYHPLWELWFVEGVDRGERVGLVHKSHHTLTDGISGIDIATVIFDISRESSHRRTSWHGSRPRTRAPGARQPVRTDQQPIQLASVARRGVVVPRDVVDRVIQTRASIGALVATDRSHRPCRSTARSGAAAGSRSCGSGSKRKRLARHSGARSTTSCSPGRWRARPPARRARRAPPRPLGEDLLPGVGARRERAHTTR